MQSLLRFARRTHLSRGDLLHQQGNRPDSLHILLRGVIELGALDEAQECGVLLLRQGDICPLAEVLADESCATSARAVTRCAVLDIPAEVVRLRSASSPTLGARFAQLLARQWHVAVREIVELKCRSAPQRLAAFLLRLADEAPDCAATQLPVPKARLAARIGIAPETLSRSLQLLAQLGLIVRGRAIEIRDRSRIEAFCRAGVD